MSTKSVAENLLIKPHKAVWLSHPARLGLIGPLPAGARLVDGPAEAATALVFADAAAALRDLLAAHREHLARPAAL